jgi:hypothetical protein
VTREDVEEAVIVGKLRTNDEQEQCFLPSLVVIV